MVGEVEWCDTVTLQSVEKLRSVPIGQPWAGMATINPFNMFGKEDRRHWAGWVYAADADTGVWKWRLKSNYPIVGGMTPTAGGVVFFGDIGGNFYALDSANGQKLWGQDLGGAIGGGVITYTANGAQKVAVAAGFTMLAWPTKIVTAKVVVLGLEAAANDTRPIRPEAVCPGLEAGEVLFRRQRSQLSNRNVAAHSKRLPWPSIRFSCRGCSLAL